jgi:para-aminobenzoate synthetase component 1
MRSLVLEVPTGRTPELLVEELGSVTGVVLLRSGLFDSSADRYSLVTSRPFLTLRSYGSRCEIHVEEDSSLSRTQFGSPWPILEHMMALYELHDQIDFPFPLGGCFGFWGYDLKNFLEPGLSRRSANDLDLPDCHLGFYDSLVVFDHRLSKTWVVSTGMTADGSRSESRAMERAQFWRDCLEDHSPVASKHRRRHDSIGDKPRPHPGALSRGMGNFSSIIHSTMSCNEFLRAVERAQELIRAGEIYQVNLSHRLRVTTTIAPWDIFSQLSAVSPAPFAAYLDCGDFQIVSSSPELFLRLSGGHIQTRPIKGTRPRSADPVRDSQLTYELQTSSKEVAELVMITDLLRNDLGKVCEYGSVQVPEMMRLERFSHVQHLVSTVEGRLAGGISHLAALAACFPGGSITGAPKYRAMEIIDQLEPTSRGPYTGSLGYLGFNRESQLAMIIRSAFCKSGQCWFQVGAGIVADSIPAAEYDETIDKARGFLAALGHASGFDKLPVEFERDSSGDLASQFCNTHQDKM